jgi:arylsulfatase A-like enzyme
VVIFTTDHGDFMGDHQLLLKAALHYQGLVRVPFIWADPDADDAGSVRSDLCGTLDIAATVLERAGIKPHNGNQGRSLIELGEGDVPVVIEEHQRRGYMGFNHGFRARTLMGRRYRMTVYDDANGFGELYDLDDDPAEQNNLFDDPGHRALRAELTEQLLHKMIGLTDISPLATHHGP